LSETELNRVFGRLFIFPARGRLSSRFGVRGDPFTRVSRFHNGIDLAGAVGTPVSAAMSGKVSMLGFNPNFGRYVILSHPEGFQNPVRSPGLVPGAQGAESEAGRVDRVDGQLGLQHGQPSALFDFQQRRTG